MKLLDILRNKYACAVPESIPELLEKGEDSESIYNAGWISGVLEVISDVSKYTDNTISLTYNIGAEVFIVLGTMLYDKVDCPACKGLNSRIMNNNIKYTCATCNGLGLVTNNKNTYRVHKGIVDHISVVINQEGKIHETIDLRDLSGQRIPPSYDKKNIFFAEVEAVKYAKELNDKAKGFVDTIDD